MLLLDILRCCIIFHLICMCLLSALQQWRLAVNMCLSTTISIKVKSPWQLRHYLKLRLLSLTVQLWRRDEVHEKKRAWEETKKIFNDLSFGDFLFFFWTADWRQNRGNHSYNKCSLLQSDWKQCSVHVVVDTWVWGEMWWRVLLSARFKICNYFM